MDWRKKTLLLCFVRCEPMNIFSSTLILKRNYRKILLEKKRDDMKPISFARPTAFQRSDSVGSDVQRAHESLARDLEASKVQVNSMFGPDTQARPAHGSRPPSLNSFNNLGGGACAGSSCSTVSCCTRARHSLKALLLRSSTLGATAHLRW